MPIPDGTDASRDLGADGQCKDVNGNGRRDIADLVLSHTQMTRIAADEPMAAFDYNRNSRINFADVVRLFTMLYGR